MYSMCPLRPVTDLYFGTVGAEREFLKLLENVNIKDNISCQEPWVVFVNIEFFIVLLQHYRNQNLYWNCTAKLESHPSRK